MNVKSMAKNAKRRRPAPRVYRSALRDEQAELTAARILDAVAALMHKGDRELTYAAIARKADVSIPTVTRHFPTRADLYRAVLAHVTKRQLAGAPLPRSMDELRPHTRDFFRRFDDPDDIVQGARLSEAFAFSRAATVPARRAMCTTLLDAEVPGVPEPQRSMLIDLAVVLFSSATGEAMRGYLELDGAQMAERVSLAMDALVTHARALAKDGR